MADQFVPITPGSGTNIDTSELTVGANTVERQRVNIADPTSAGGLAPVLATTPDGTEYGLATRQVGPVSLADIAASIRVMLDMLGGLPLAFDPASGRLRVVIDALGGAQTLGTITTVQSVTGVARMGTALVDVSSFPFDAMMTNWANCVRARIT